MTLSRFISHPTLQKRQTIYDSIGTDLFMSLHLRFSCFLSEIVFKPKSTFHMPSPEVLSHTHAPDHVGALHTRRKESGLLSSSSPPTPRLWLFLESHLQRNIPKSHYHPIVHSPPNSSLNASTLLSSMYCNSLSLQTDYSHRRGVPATLYIFSLDTQQSGTTGSQNPS